MVMKKEQVLIKMSESNVVILNVLPKSNFQKLHITGSQSMPLTEDLNAFAAEVEKKFGKDKQFIAYGDHFGFLESYEAAKALNEKGLKAENYSGGVQEWFKAGYPSEGTEAVINVSAPPANPAVFKSM
jgi:rhodanese-related sulfurtransferase